MTDGRSRRPGTAATGSEPVAIHPYDARWPAAFETEKARLAGVFGHIQHSIEHIGSTAMPGLDAKPVIDLMLGVERLRDVDARLPNLDLARSFRRDRDAYTEAKSEFIEGILRAAGVPVDRGAVRRRAERATVMSDNADPIVIRKQGGT